MDGQGVTLGRRDGAVRQRPNQPASGNPRLDIDFLSPDGSQIGDGNGFLTGLDPISRNHLVDTFQRNPQGTSYEVIQHPADGITLVAVAAVERSLNWSASAIPDSIQRRDGAIIVGRLSPEITRKRLQEFGEAFAMSPSVVRTLVALYEHCDVKTAAAAAEISFYTAKDNLKQARAAIWASNLPRLITWAGVGSLMTDAVGENDQIVGELFALTDRQRNLAAQIADGATRADAAELLGISDAVAKKELAKVFEATGVTNAIGLARLFADLRAVAILTNNLGPAEPFPPPYSHELKVPDGNGREIAVSDYGPPDGKPVFVLHNTMNCRGVDRALVGALQNSGYRPISPDRPGYGDTDPVSGDGYGQAYLQVCTQDFAAICSFMGWTRVPVIAHGPVHIALALAQDLPDLIDKVIIDAPERYSAGDTAQGMIAGLKRKFAKRPWAVEAVVRMMCTLANFDRVRSNMQNWVADSPADRAAMADPALMMDFYRKLIPFRRGRVDGFVREQVLQATLEEPTPIPGTRKFSLLIGETDFMHDAAESLAYWRRALPDARVKILPGAGRFISYSHPDALIAELHEV